MKSQMNGASPIPSTAQRLPLHLAIWTWIAAAGFSICTYFTLRPYQHGLEWLGTPLAALACWAWCIVVSAAAGIMPGFFVLDMKWTPVYITIGAITLALVATAMGATGRQRPLLR